MPELALDLVIARKEALADGVVRLTLARTDGAELPTWEAGAHVDLHFTSKGIDFVRQYSLCGREADRQHWQIAVLHVTDGRGGSAHLHESAAEGDRVRASGPRNNFPVLPANRYRFIAGGIGITPILPMVRQAAVSGADWRLLYSGRSFASMAFVEQVAALGPDKVRLHESDRHGLADLDAFIAEAGPDALVYCCGPEPMLRAVENSPLAGDRVRLERFSKHDAGGADANLAFEVEFARSGIVATVPPDRSILQVAQALGVEIDSSCEEGVCRTCETGVTSGTPDHRDSVLTAKERTGGRCIMVCVSRSRSARLVLDA